MDFCVAHSGGPCSKPGCTATPCSNPIQRISHTGEEMGMVDGRAWLAEGSTGQVVSSGGIRECLHEDCSKQVQGSAMYCKAHGGGQRCTVPGCNRSAHGSTTLCIGHGGGRRCSVPGCPNGACASNLGRLGCCVRHGGGKRCKFDGCGKGAQGNTDFCIAHGGGKRCRFEGCVKSAQGGTDFCIRHGGGKRCGFQGCTKSAQWRMDFCSAHRPNPLTSLPVAQERLLVLQPQHGKARKEGGKVGRGRPRGSTSTLAIAASSTDKMGIPSAVGISLVSKGSPQKRGKKRRAPTAPHAVVTLAAKPPSSLSGPSGGEGVVRSRVVLL